MTRRRRRREVAVRTRRSALIGSGARAARTASGSRRHRVQADDLVDLVVAGRQPRIGILARRPGCGEGLEPVDAGEAHVEDDEVRGLTGRDLKAFLARPRGRDVVASCWGRTGSPATAVVVRRSRSWQPRAMLLRVVTNRAARWASAAKARASTAAKRAQPARECVGRAQRATHAGAAQAGRSCTLRSAPGSLATSGPAGEPQPAHTDHHPEVSRPWPPPVRHSLPSTAN